MWGGEDGGIKQYLFESEFFSGLLETKMIITALWLLLDRANTSFGQKCGDFFYGNVVKV